MTKAERILTSLRSRDGSLKFQQLSPADSLFFLAFLAALPSTFSFANERTTFRSRLRSIFQVHSGHSLLGDSTERTSIGIVSRGHSSVFSLFFLLPPPIVGGRREGKRERERERELKKKAKKKREPDPNARVHVGSRVREDAHTRARTPRCLIDWGWQTRDTVADAHAFPRIHAMSTKNIHARQRARNR